MTPTRLTLWLAVLFGIVTLWLDLRMTTLSSLSELSMLAFLIGESLWTLSPYVVLLAAARFGKFPPVTWGAPVVLLAVGLYGNLAYADVNFHFWTKSDAQEALVFLFMPFVQNFVVVVAMGVLFAIGAWLDRRKRP
jgi:hypothetical protein